MSKLQTEIAISSIKDFFSVELIKNLDLIKIASPIMVEGNTGINDDLNGIEQPVQVHIQNYDNKVEIVQSLAKWKRTRLHELEIEENIGILTDMKAIRPDESISDIHSYYVDQWDWEKHINQHNRTLSFLKKEVKKIYNAIKSTALYVESEFEGTALHLPSEIFFIHSENLLKLFPNLNPKERENEICKLHKAVFIIGIGGELSHGQSHDGRAPDYDDWSSLNEEGYNGLNGDIVVWNPVLNRAFELSSMGIRVNSKSLITQLRLARCEQRLSLHFHDQLQNDIYPQSIGGGIGQSRLCMFLLQKKHIAEVQPSVWPKSTIDYLQENNLICL